MPSRLMEGKVAIVTGASRGIGKAIATALVRENVRVVLVGRDKGKLETVAEELGTNAFPYEANLSLMPVTGRHVAEYIASHFGKIDIVINNAASLHAPCGLLDNFNDPMDVTNAWTLNVLAPMQLAKVLHGDLERRHTTGDLINISSLAAIMPAPQQGVYGIFKAAMLSLTRTLSVEMRKSHLRVFGVLPGVTDTEMASPLINGPTAERILKNIPTHRWNTSEDIANAVMFLLKSGTNGDIVQVNGGEVSALNSF